jgi:hypothetical protein
MVAADPRSWEFHRLFPLECHSGRVALVSSLHASDLRFRLVHSGPSSQQQPAAPLPRRKAIVSEYKGWNKLTLNIRSNGLAQRPPSAGAGCLCMRPRAPWRCGCIPKEAPPPHESGGRTSTAIALTLNNHQDAEKKGTGTAGGAISDCRSGFTRTAVPSLVSQPARTKSNLILSHTRNRHTAPRHSCHAHSVRVPQARVGAGPAKKSPKKREVCRLLFAFCLDFFPGPCL